MLRNLLIAALLAVWFVLVVVCTLCRQWALVVALFGLAWLVEQSVSYACDEE
jgi:hypothetical protein